MSSARISTHVEVGERLVQEECLRLADERASQRDALPLPSRQLGWSPPEQGSAADYGSSLLYSAPRLSPFDAPGTQAEPDVLLDRKVREERVALEDHRDVAIPRGQRRDVTVAEEDTPLGRLLEPRNETQRCALLTFTSIGNRYEGTEPLYSQSTIPLPDSAAGKTIKIRFHFQSDGSSRIPSTGLVGRRREGRRGDGLRCVHWPAPKGAAALFRERSGDRSETAD